MIAYRAEIWCDKHGCSEGYATGTAHDDPTQLPGLARNLIEIRTHEGWQMVGQRHFCPKHATERFQPKKAKKCPTKTPKAEAVLCGEPGK